MIWSRRAHKKGLNQSALKLAAPLTKSKLLKARSVDKGSASLKWVCNQRKQVTTHCRKWNWVQCWSIDMNSVLRKGWSKQSWMKWKQNCFASCSQKRVSSKFTQRLEFASKVMVHKSVAKCWCSNVLQSASLKQLWPEGKLSKFSRNRKCN